MARQNDEEIKTRVETSLRKRFREKIWCNFTKAVRQYELVKPGDCIAVCISGGKDSMLMAKLFQELKLHNKFPFEVRFLVMDPGYSPANRYLWLRLQCRKVPLLSLRAHAARLSL